MPPTEKRGRVHSSTVTVAVLSIASDTASKDLAVAEIYTDWFSGTGKGGQHRNKHQNSCRLTHIPTNTTVVSQCRSRTQSYQTALAELTKRVNQAAQAQHNASTAANRAQQTGSGMRADKIRTYRFQDNIVKDHQTGKSAKVSHVMRGQMDKLWH